METQENAFKEIIKYGLILGFVQISLTIVMYLTDISLLVGFKGSGIRLLVVAILVVVFAIRVRTLQGGLITFGEGFKAMFVMGLIGMLMDTTLVYVLYNFIDADLAEQTKQITINTTQEMLEKFNVPADQMEKSMEEIEKQDFSYSILKMLQAIFGSAVVGSGFSAIVAAIIKKESKFF